MPVREHPAQAKPNGPSKKPVDECAAGQFIVNAVSQPGLAAGSLELMPVNPFYEWSMDLFVDEKPVPLVCSVQRCPTEYPDTKFHASASLDPAGSADYAQRRERRSQQ